jgi:16S rRNA (uracil1498-N3)-methyltransferase
MAQTRIFCSRKKIEDGVFTIYGEEAHHALRVLRHKPGDTINIFTEQGSEFRCTILTAGKQHLKARIDEKLTDSVESPLSLNLIQAMPKAAKIELIIVHGTELGLNNLYPFYSDHSVRKSDRPDRWQKLALEAAKQSRRRVIPRIHPAVTMDKLDLAPFEGTLKLIAAEPPRHGSLQSIVAEAGPVSEATIVVGPEGGFSEEEYQYFIDQGFKPFSMGKRVLRTQTASLAAFAALQMLCGDWETTEER